MSRNACNGENGEKITRLWRFELDAKSGPLERAGDNGEKHLGPLETGHFGENGDSGEIGDFCENHRRASDIQNVANIQIGCQKWPLQIR